MNSVEWSQDTKNNIGLPRPYFNVPENRRKQAITSPLKLKTKKYLHSKIPIPWQSEPVFNHEKQLNLLLKNEESVYANGICAYCGINFKEDDLCVRWITLIGMATKKGPNVFSDNYPFHIECMKQARIFCPRMRQTENSEFEYGRYQDLKENFLNDFKEILIKNDIFI